jgi:hypothetical protein
MKKMHFPAYQDTPIARTQGQQRKNQCALHRVGEQTRPGPFWFDLRDNYRGCGGFRSVANDWNTASLVKGMEALAFAIATVGGWRPAGRGAHPTGTS